MIVVETTRRTPPLPKRPRVWTANDAGLFVPDFEATSGGILVSRETMDEVEAEASAASGVIFSGYSASISTCPP